MLLNPPLRHPHRTINIVAKVRVLREASQCRRHGNKVVGSPKLGCLNTTTYSRESGKGVPCCTYDTYGVGRTAFFSETFFISSTESHFSQYKTNHPEAPGNAGESREHYAKKSFENEYNLEELERHMIMLLERGKKPVLKKKPLFIFFRASREFI